MDRIAGICLRARIAVKWGYASSTTSRSDSTGPMCEDAIKVARFGNAG
ncbi:MAG: hypothetical protein QXN93_01580 [Methanomassiliicoccales archaeon]